MTDTLPTFIFLLPMHIFEQKWDFALKIKFVPNAVMSFINRQQRF